MKINDLQVLFKSSRFNETDEIMKFVVDLLGKFELALTWDNEHLIIPSLLPSEAMLKFTKNSIQLEILSKDKALSRLFDEFSAEDPHIISNFYKKRYSQPMAASASCVSFSTGTSEPVKSNLSVIDEATAKLTASHSQFIFDKPSQSKQSQSFVCQPLYRSDQSLVNV